jgi:hypothetical protein
MEHEFNGLRARLNAKSGGEHKPSTQHRS